MFLPHRYDGFSEGEHRVYHPYFDQHENGLVTDYEPEVDEPPQYDLGGEG